MSHQPTKWMLEKFGEFLDVESGADPEGNWLLDPCPLTAEGVMGHSSLINFSKGAVRCSLCCSPKKAMSIQNALMVMKK